MLIISHRGNISGPDKEIENNPKHLEQVMREYCVEVDLRVHKNKLYLGHDECQYEIKRDWLFNHYSFLWVHCKNADALEYCSQMPFLHYFWHNTDDYTITNKNMIWAYPGKRKINDFTILVMPEPHWTHDEIVSFEPYGICSDYVEAYKYINKE